MKRILRIFSIRHEIIKLGLAVLNLEKCSERFEYFLYVTTQDTKTVDRELEWFRIKSHHELMQFAQGLVDFPTGLFRGHRCSNRGQDFTRNLAGVEHSLYEGEESLFKAKSDNFSGDVRAAK